MAYGKKRSYSNMRKGKKYSRKSKRPTGVPRAALVRAIRNVTMRTTESKSKYVSHDKIEMYHQGFNVTLGFNQPGAMPTQGTGDNQRIGDQINLSGFKFKILFGQKGDRPNVNFKWWILKVPKGSAINYNNWFNVITSNTMLDDPNTDFVKILKKGYMRPNQAGLTATGDDEFTFVKEIYLPYKKLLKFGPANAAVTHNDDDLYLVVIAYDAYGTLITDNIAYMQTLSTMYYKDP